MEHTPPTPAPRTRQDNIFARMIFASRWLQLPIYLGLIVVQAIYAYKFLKLLWHLVANLGRWTKTPLCSPCSTSSTWS